MKNNKIFKMLPLVALLSVATGALVACGGGNNQSSQTTSVYVPTLNQTVTVTPITEEFNTHPDAVDTFMACEHSEIGSVSSASLKANTLTLNWEAEGDDTVEKFKVELAENENIDNPLVYEVDASKKSLDITNLKVGTTYYWRVTAIAGDKDARSEVSSFQTKAGPVRIMNVGGVNNVRDMGGWVTEDGKVVKQGLAFRGGEFNKQNNTSFDPDEEVERAKEKPYGMNVTEDGVRVIKEEMKLKTEIDLRGYEEYNYIEGYTYDGVKTNFIYQNPKPKEIGGLSEGHGLWEDINYVLAPVDTNGSGDTRIYRHDYGKAAVKKIFTVFADEANYPIYYHCAQGKDRTGFVGSLLMSFLGCKWDDILRDYMFSKMTGQSVTYANVWNDSTEDHKGKNYDYLSYLYGIDCGGDNLPKATDSNTVAERANAYLLSCGLTQDQLDNIRTIFLGD